MKKLLLVSVIAAAMGMAASARAGVSVRIGLPHAGIAVGGCLPPPVYVPPRRYCPPPVYYAPPPVAYYPAPVVVVPPPRYYYPPGYIGIPRPPRHCR